MTRSHGWRWWNTLYIYKEDLPWVWTGWGVLIISTNWESTFCTHDIHSQVIESKYQGVAASIWHSHSSRCWIALHMHKEDLLWVWRGCGVLIISTNWESTFCTHDIHSQVTESKYQGVMAASLWPVATVQGAETLNVCITKTCYEYEGDVGS